MKPLQYILFLLSISIFLPLQIIAQNNNNNNNTSLKANQGHTDAITDFVLSLDNKYLITCSEDKTIILWDYETQKEIKTIKGHQNIISCIDINASNTQIATGEAGKDDNVKYTVKIWDIITGNEIRTIKPNAGRIKTVKFSADGKFIIVGAQNKIIKYDLETGSKTIDYIGFKLSLNDIKLSADFKFITAYTSKKILIWDVNSREPIKTIENKNAEFSALWVDKKANSIITGNSDNSIRMYNTITGEESKTFTLFRYPIFTVTASNNNKIIAASDSKSEFFKLIDYTTGEEINSIDAHKGRIGTIKFSTNNQLVITSGSWDKTVKVWSVNSGNLVKTFSGLAKNIYQQAFIDSAHYYSVGKYRNRAFINYMSKNFKNNEFKDKNGEVSCVTLSNNKHYIAYGTSKKHSKIISAITGKVKHKFITQKTWIREIAFSNNDNYLATGSFEQLIIWDVETGKEVISIDKKFKVPHVIRFSKDNKYIAVGCFKKAKIFEVATGKEIKSFSSKEIIYSVDFSNDGKYLATGEGNKTQEGKYKINIWNIKTGKTEKSFTAHTRQITNLRFTTDDKTLASSGNRVIKLWDISGDKPVEKMTIDAHARWINDINFSENNAQLISTSQDGTVKIWDLITGKLLLTEIGLKATENWISFTPDGRFDGTKEGINSFYFVKNMQVVPLENLFDRFYTPKLTAEISVNSADTNISIAKLENLPKIAITKPSNTAPVFRGAVETLLTTNEKSTTVTAKITDMGGGVSEIRVYQNKKLIITDKIEINEKGKTISKDYVINLAKGLNIIEVASYNNDNTKNSKRVGIEYTGNEFNPANLYVFAIGINNYKKPSYSLNYAVSDATSFVKEITGNSKTIFAKTEVISLINENATKDSILAAFNKIKANAQQNDVFVFYYAGHGAMSAAEQNEKANFYLIPWEVTNLYNNQMLKEKAVSAQDLRKFSEEIKAEKQLFLLDACQSGGAVEFLASRGAEEEKAIAQLAHSTGTYFITASGSQQLAGEFGQLGHGVFTYAVLEALKGNASKNDKKVTVKELTYYVEEQVPVLSEKYKGNIQYPTSYGFGQDFPLVLLNAGNK